ncbi:hypothetical protein BAU15_14085 [Enterococcus sp. JM4C]|uniref:nucleotide sugar dehydrogenase n=1 Tax=Candidatus Enterococcus huntleyi TaxID=1857217 RepID=UPI001379C90B|nr:nucleotide sugar dehydrogenase [Enterococcus sp. JM4C]KAF1295997.1 hypothetical protein BAU15_14085 [Enterococcus sp. JM4C]
MITVIGLGYVGLASALFFSATHKIMGIDTDAQRVAQLNLRQSPIKEQQMQERLSQLSKDDIQFFTNYQEEMQASDYVFFSLPTNFDEQTQSFDTQALTESLKSFDKRLKKEAIFVIKSTIPLGYTERIQQQLTHQVLFVPEFLREGTALNDSYFPSRLIIGNPTSNEQTAQKVAHLYSDIIKKTPAILHMSAKEAEAVKLFSNNYLAMRVAFFNELDSLCEVSNIDSQLVIQGLSEDPRIGKGYNNPSFGFGGYCLPKDNQALISEFSNVGIESPLINGIQEANQQRIDYIAEQLKDYKTIGFYRLSMKMNSDNYRVSATYALYQRLKEANYSVKIYDSMYEGPDKEADLETFATQSEVIVTNRWYEELRPYEEKVYTRDLYHEN